MYLFGSKSRGESKIDSDIDFLLVINSNLDAKSKREIKRNLSLYLKEKDSLEAMDLLIKNNEEWDWESNNFGFLAYKVKREGIRL